MAKKIITLSLRDIIDVAKILSLWEIDIVDVRQR